MVLLLTLIESLPALQDKNAVTNRCEMIKVTGNVWQRCLARSRCMINTINAHAEVVANRLKPKTRRLLFDFPSRWRRQCSRCNLSGAE